MSLGRRGSLLVALVCASLLCCALLARSASAAQDGAFGVNVQTLMNWSAFWGPNDTSGHPDVPPAAPYLSALAADGVGVARTDAPWYWVQPSGPGSFDWSELDPVVHALAQAGLRWQPVLDLAPAWAAQAFNTPTGCTQVEQRYLPPQSAAQYAAFAGAIAQRYGVGGTFWAANQDVPQLPVTSYEIWNEPNVDAYWNNAPSATQYVALYNAARAAIRAADPAAQVLVGGIVWGGQVNCASSVTNDDTYIEAMFAAAGKNWSVDGIAVHPYGPAVLNLVANVRREQRALQTVGSTDVPLEQTELGWPARPAGAPAGSYAATFADDASRAGTMALASDVLMGSDCNMRSFDAYTAVEREAETVSDDPASTYGPYDLVEHWMGIYRYATDGSAPPTLTSAAFAGAIGRDLAGDNALHEVPVCAPAASGGHLLTLALSVAPTTQSGCFNATVTYLGMPVSGAELRASTPIQPAGTSAFGPTFTDPDGLVGFCVPAGGDPTVVADVGGGSFAPDFVPLVAQSNQLAVQGPPGSSTTSTTTTSGVTSAVMTSPAGSSPAVTTTAATVTTTTSAVVSTPVVSPPPACALSGLRFAREPLAAVRRHGLSVLVGLATLGSPHGCALSLTLRSRGVAVGSAHATLLRVGVTAVTVRLSRAGSRALRGKRAMTLTLRADLPGAAVGLGSLSEQLRLRS